MANTTGFVTNVETNWAARRVTYLFYKPVHTKCYLDEAEFRDDLTLSRSE